jgi:hypothetical protein
MTTDDETPAVPTKSAAGRSGWSAVAGVLAAMLVIMGVGMLVAQVVSGANGQPGPGALSVGAHLAGAVVGVGCYQVSLRRRGRSKAAALVVSALVTVALLVLFWLSPT